MDIHPIIWLAIALLIVREVGDKLNRWRKRHPPRKVDEMALNAGIVENTAPDPTPERLKIQENGFENGVEVRWYRKSAADGGSTHIPVDELIPFLEKHRDYALWYQVVRHDFAGGVHEWIVSQPDCPNAVAAAFIDAVGGADLYGLTSRPSHSNHIYRAAEIVSRRDMADGFPSDTMRDPEPGEPGFFFNFERLDRKALLEQCEAAAHAQLALGKTPIYAVPKNLLSKTPTGPRLRTEYSVDDTGIS